MLSDIDYPILRSQKKQLLLALGIGTWVFLFLFFAEPFKIDRFSLSKKLVVLPLYGLIESTIIAISLVYQYWILKQRDRWAASHELTYAFIVVSVAWVCNYLFYVLFVTSGENTYSVVDHARYHFLPALLLVLPVLLAARFFFGAITSTRQVNETFTFEGSGLRDYLSIPTKNLLCVNAEGNYVKVQYLENDSVQRKMIRTNLSAYQSSDALISTHRSYLVNPAHIKEYNYHNRNLFLTLTGDVTVPVARSKKKGLVALIDERRPEP